MSSHLTLFAQVPISSKFRFENADAGKVFVKTSEEGAHHDGAYQPINLDVLVFPVPDPIILAEFTTRDGNQWLAHKTNRGYWYLTPKGGLGLKNSRFASLEDAINHLGAA